MKKQVHRIKTECSFINEVTPFLKHCSEDTNKLCDVIFLEKRGRMK